MAKIRSTHPGQWVDDRYVTTTIPARLLAIAVRNFADDNGIFEWNPLKLKMQIFPADVFSIDDMKNMLAELVETEQVLKYDQDGKIYGIIRNFRLFQSPQKPSFIYPVPSDELLTPGYELHAKFTGKGMGRLREQSHTSTRAVSDQSHTGTVLVQEGDKTKPLGVGEGKGSGKGMGEGEGDPITNSSSSITSGKEEKPAAAAAHDDEEQKPQAAIFVEYFTNRGLKKTVVEKPSCLSMFDVWIKAGITTAEVASVINPIVKREAGKVTSPMYFEPAMAEFMANKKSTVLTKPNTVEVRAANLKCTTPGCKNDAPNSQLYQDKEGKPVCPACLSQALNKKAAGEN